MWWDWNVTKEYPEKVVFVASDSKPVVEKGKGYQETTDAGWFEQPKWKDASFPTEMRGLLGLFRHLLILIIFQVQTISATAACISRVEMGYYSAAWWVENCARKPFPHSASWRYRNEWWDQLRLRILWLVELSLGKLKWIYWIRNPITFSDSLVFSLQYWLKFQVRRDDIEGFYMRFPTWSRLLKYINH
jgi:hypothetical protein